MRPLPNGEGDVVEYYPMLPGKYRFNVLYGGEAIPGIRTEILHSCSKVDTEISGSPFIFVVEAEGLANAHGEGLHRGIEGVTSMFYVDARGLVGEPTVQVT